MPFDIHGSYESLKAAKQANKAWYKQACDQCLKLYKEQIKSQNVSLETKGHFYDSYQQNLESLKKQYKTNLKNLITKFSDVKVVKSASNTTSFSKLKRNATNVAWYKKLWFIFSNKKVLAGIAFTTFLLVIFHVGSIITIPGIAIPDSYNPSNDFAGMLNLLAGGGLTQMSIFAIGVGPYITSQIIVQLLSSDLIPPLSRMQKQGERGKRKLEIITRLLTFPFCLIQAYAVMVIILNMNSSGSSQGQFSIFGHTEIGQMTAGEVVGMMAILTGGTYIAIFLGDMITKRGVGNGVTLIILAGILSNLFGNFRLVFASIARSFSSVTVAYALVVAFGFGIYCLFYFLILLVVTFINISIRKIPIQQTGQGLTSNVNELPYLPIKFNSAGVIPVIFASSVMTIPSTIAQFLKEGDEKWVIEKWFILESWLGIALYFILTILFTFFYSYVQINPTQMEENFIKSGKFIPGVKSPDTAKHITKVLSRVNWLGGPFLAIIAALPYVISKVTSISSSLALGGTGIIIIVSATIEVWNSIKSAATNTGYEITRTKIQSNFYDSVNKEAKVEELW